MRGDGENGPDQPPNRAPSAPHPSPQRIAVTGCWSTLRPQQAANLSGVTLVVENERKDLLHTLLEPWSADFDDPDDLARVQPDGTPLAMFGASSSELTAYEPHPRLHQGAGRLQQQVHLLHRHHRARCGPQPQRRRDRGRSGRAGG
ncbi:MAG: hypothetical protein R2854_19645 [Caldilineaceae bacterium]